MTNKLEISRELACPFCGSHKLKHVTDDGIHFTQCKSCEATGPTGFKRGEDDAVDWNTRAAPVVERQEKSNKCERCGASTVESCNYLGCHFLESGNGEPVPPPIQNLPTNGALISALTTTIAQQAQRIADLERGRGEPVAWGVNSDLAAIKGGALWSGTLWGKKSIPPFEERSPLYAEQPAPVSVVLVEIHKQLVEMRQQFERANFVKLGSLLTAAIDKVKELNPTTSAASNSLRNFANAMIDIALEGGNADGAQIQELAVEHGLLKPEQRTERCGDTCSCAEYADFPVECFRKVKELNQ